MTDELLSDEMLLRWFRELRHEQTLLRIEAFERLAAIIPSHIEQVFRLLLCSEQPMQKIIVGFLAYVEKRYAHPDTCFIFLQVLLKSTDSDFRHFCANWFRSIIDNRIRRRLPDELLEYLFHDEAEIRVLMILLVRQSQCLKAVPHLIHLLVDDSPNVRLAASKALKELNSPEAQFALTGLEDA